MIRERVNAGLARAKDRGTRLGRRPVKSSVEERVRELRAQGMGILKIGRTLGIGTSVCNECSRPWPTKVRTGSASTASARDSIRDG
jgi:DNA invertase Pin-like site-specific DNA recombinase